MNLLALVLRPDTAGIWQMLGLALEKVGELGNGRDAFERACELEDAYGPDAGQSWQWVAHTETKRLCLRRRSTRNPLDARSSKRQWSRPSRVDAEGKLFRKYCLFSKSATKFAQTTRPGKALQATDCQVQATHAGVHGLRGHVGHETTGFF